MRFVNLALAFVAATVCAARDPAIDPAAFSALDLGYISRGEAKGTSLEGRFDALDVNQDGRLSPSEIYAGEAACLRSKAKQ